MGDLVPIEKAGPHEPVPVLQIRGIEVVLDQDLARVFDLETRVLNQRLKRNQDRFPDSWLFQLTKDEFENLKSRNVISRDGWGGRRTPPWALSEYGVVMAATLINTDIAVQARQNRHSAHPDHCSGEEEEACEVYGVTVVAGRDAAIMLELVEAALDSVAHLVGFAIIGDGLLSR